MIKLILAFLIIFVICYFGIKSFRDLTCKDKWALTKLLAYTTICSVLTVVLLILITILF
jgi:hypothetical protein